MSSDIRDLNVDISPLPPEASAEASLARWQAVVSNMAEGVVVADAGGQVLDWNAAALHMHGYSDMQDARRQLHEFPKIFDLIDTDGRVLPLDQWPLSRALRGESFTGFEVTVRRRDKELVRIISYSGSPVRDPNGKITTAVLTLHDVTDERNAQRALAKSETAFRDMFEQTPIGMTITDLEGRYLHVNPAYCRLVGYSREELLHSNMDSRSLVHPEDRPKMLKLHRQVLSGEIPAFFLEKRYIRKDGSSVWVRVTGTLRRGTDSGAAQFIRLVEDIDDRKRIEAEREQILDSERAARRDAERASRLKDEFLATLSHELRTPLNAIVGWSQILEHGDREPEALSEGLAAIGRNARAQAQLIEDLLDMSRILTGKLRLDVRRLNPAEVVEAAVESVTPAARAKEIRVEKVVATIPGVVSADPHRLQQVVWNLLTNAVKFTPKGGKIQVLLERVNSHIEISVSDTGRGIKPEFLPFVFERFRQEDATTTRRYGGLGLGLSLAKQLTEMHGGTIGVRSPGEGMGATFTIKLPLSIAHGDHGESGSALGSFGDSDFALDLSGVKVLVIDDEPDAQALAKRILESCGASVQTAGSAAAGMELFYAERPDVIVSDIGMPGEDGYSFIRRIRSLDVPEGGQTPAAAVTAFARSEDRRRALLAGYQSHVVKPVEPAELVTVVASLAGRTGR